MPKDEPPLCGHFQTTTLSKIIGINMFPCTAEMQKCVFRRADGIKLHSELLGQENPVLKKS